MYQQLVSASRNRLRKIVASSLANSEPHSSAFVRRILCDLAYSNEIPQQLNLEISTRDNIYEGFPQVAATGFMVDGASDIPEEVKEYFFAGVNRLMSRSEAGIRPLIGDDVALLGIACGLSKLSSSNSQTTKPLIEWMLRIINNSPRQRQWSYRMRELAGDLLDGRGRLRALPITTDLSERALETVLRDTWPQSFESVPLQSEDEYQLLLSDLLKADAPSSGEVERGAVCWRALDVAIEKLTSLISSRDSDSTNAINQLTCLKDKLDREAERKVSAKIWFSFGVGVFIVVTLAWLTYKYGWDTMEPWTYFIGLSAAILGYGYFAITNKELSPSAIHERLIAAKKAELYRKYSFDLEAYESLRNKADIDNAIQFF